MRPLHVDILVRDERLTLVERAVWLGPIVLVKRQLQLLGAASIANVFHGFDLVLLPRVQRDGFGARDVCAQAAVHAVAVAVLGKMM